MTFTSASSNTVTFTKLVAPELNGQSIITWQPIAGATSYDIYMYDTEDKLFKLINTTEGTRFEARDQYNGKRFVVVAKSNVAGTIESNFSNEVTARGI